MERQMQQLAETDRRKDEFLAILAHELRNPLQPLQTAVEVLEHEPDKPVPVRIRKIVQRQVQHITRLVDDLLDVARFTAGKLELRREPTDLDEVVDEALASCATAIESRRHRVKVTPHNPPAIVNGDSVRLVQCVCNLLNNAAKYTEPGGALGIEWGADRNNGFVRVTDNGRGIPPDLLPKIFDMFVQERVTPDGAGGLGLGLGLVKRLIELHGGVVRATSPGQGKGAAFEIRLPLVDAQILEKLKPMRPKPMSQAQPLRAVVCDDAPDLRDLVADLLRLRGHQVTVVGDGPAAIDVIVAEKPDVALIDIGLPDMDGYEVARQIRRQLSEHKLRLIAMTGYGQASDRAAAFEAGFDAHIVKPASADKILRALYGTEEA
jgi:CheY-like chemotaxis protein